MKKIVGILAAAAMVASVFAADLTGGVRLAGDLFNYDGTAEAAKALKLDNQNRNWEVPLTLSVSSDNAGGTFKFWDNESSAFETGKWAIWFKPMDMLKVNLGTIDKSMNVETIDWGGRLINYDSFGASVDVNVDAFSATLSFVTGNGNYWFTDKKAGWVADKAKEFADTSATAEIDAEYAAWLALNPTATDKEKAEEKKSITEAIEAEKAALLAESAGAYVGELNLYAQYAADFGTISAMFDFKNTFSNIAMGAGYKNTFGDLTVFADAAIYMDAKYKFNDDGDAIVKDGFVNSIGVDADVTYAKDALNAQLYVQWKSALKDMDKDVMDVLTIAKVSYALDAGTVFLYFKDADLLADDFACTIKPGFDGKVGIMDYEIAAQFDIAKKVNISVPVWFKVAF